MGRKTIASKIFANANALEVGADTSNDSFKFLMASELHKIYDSTHKDGERKIQWKPHAEATLTALAGHPSLDIGLIRLLIQCPFDSAHKALAKNIMEGGVAISLLDGEFCNKYMSDVVGSYHYRTFCIRYLHNDLTDSYVHNFIECSYFTDDTQWVALLKREEPLDVETETRIAEIAEEICTYRTKAQWKEIQDWRNVIDDYSYLSSIEEKIKYRLCNNNFGTRVSMMTFICKLMAHKTEEGKRLINKFKIIKKTLITKLKEHTAYLENEI